MSVKVLSPKESAREARQGLIHAAKVLGEAQAAIAQAMATLDLFEENFRRGWYKTTDTPSTDTPSSVTVTCP